MAKGKTEPTTTDIGQVKDNTHIERTALQFRQSGFFLTQIESFRQCSPSVRLIQLKILPPSARRIEGLPDHTCEQPHLFTFLPGQWIDTYVPHVPKPGGFSFVSTPKYFRSRGLATLAIQRTENPPSKWLWRDDIVGQNLMIRVGGNFTFPPTGKSPDVSQVDHLQFVAGGVGINMLQSICEEDVVHHNAKIVLHYLVRVQHEALFLDTIAIVKRHFGDMFEGHLWVTRQDTSGKSANLEDHSLQIHRQIVSAESDEGQQWGWWDSFLQMAVARLDTEEERARSLAYICGPQGLTDRLVDVYEKHGMSTTTGHVQVEKWW